MKSQKNMVNYNFFIFILKVATVEYLLVSFKYTKLKSWLSHRQPILFSGVEIKIKLTPNDAKICVDSFETNASYAVKIERVVLHGYNTIQH